jgi:hypothetical protein
MVRRLTFDMRGPQKAQPFVGPLDGRVRRRFAPRTHALAFVRLMGAFARLCFNRSAVMRAMRSYGIGLS